MNFRAVAIGVACFVAVYLWVQVIMALRQGFTLRYPRESGFFQQDEWKGTLYILCSAIVITGTVAALIYLP